MWGVKPWDDGICHLGYYGVGSCNCGNHSRTPRIVHNSDVYGYRFSHTSDEKPVAERTTLPDGDLTALRSMDDLFI